MHNWENDSVKTALFVILAICLIVLIVVPANLVFAQQADFVACRGATISDDQIDGTIGGEWNDAGSYANVSIAPYGIAHFWTKQDGSFLYMGLKFVADSNNPWVAFQLGHSFCMSTTVDGALFGDDNYGPSEYQDISFTGGVVGIAPDKVQNGIGAINVNGSNFVTVELKKPLNSGDVAGKDINWGEGNAYAFLVVWDSEGGGSSGGGANHAATTPRAYTLLISEDPMPEFPSTSIVLVAVVSATSLILLAKRRRATTTSKRDLR